uniref:Uncharacterized protein n=1 Tax=Caenorhabditis tropicalis TaxID=1561998 RepID=A0A1I7TRK7_9PELO
MNKKNTPKSKNDNVLENPLFSPPEEPINLPQEPPLNYAQLTEQQMAFNKLMLDVRRIQITNGLGTVPEIDGTSGPDNKKAMEGSTEPAPGLHDQWIEGVGRITRTYQSYVKAIKDILKKCVESEAKEIFIYQIYFKKGFRKPEGSIVVRIDEKAPENPSQEYLDDQVQIKLAFGLVKNMVVANDENVSVRFQHRFVLVKRKVAKHEIPPNVFVRCIPRDLGRERPHLEEILDMRSLLTEEEMMKKHKDAALYPDYWTYEMIEYTGDIYWGTRKMDLKNGYRRENLPEGVLIPPESNYPPYDPDYKVVRRGCPIKLPDARTMKKIFKDHPDEKKKTPKPRKSNKKK